MLERELGRGGMASVWAATHVRTKHRAAIKILHAGLAADQQLRERFLREAYAANRVGHPGLVRVLEDGEVDGCSFLVMELLTGTTLRERARARGGRLAVQEVGPLISELLDALGAAHAAGVIHRDVKPDNVFFTTQGEVKLLDFGIARADADDRGFTTETGAMLGTPAFMPPEQALGRFREVDAASDVFAVGATAFHVLTGRAVHTASTAPEMRIAAATKHAPPIATVLPEIAPEPAAVIDRALAFDKSMRFATASEMKIAWDRAWPLSARPAPVVKTVPIVVGGASGSATPATAGPAAFDARAAPPRRREWGPILAIAGIAMAVSALGVLGWLWLASGRADGRSRTTPTTEPAPRDAKSAAPGPAASTSTPSPAPQAAEPSSKDLEVIATSLRKELGASARLTDVDFGPWNGTVRVLDSTSSEPGYPLAIQAYEITLSKPTLQKRQKLIMDSEPETLRSLEAQAFALTDLPSPATIDAAIIEAKRRFTAKTASSGQVVGVSIGRYLGAMRTTVFVESAGGRTKSCFDGTGTRVECSSGK